VVGTSRILGEGKDIGKDILGSVVVYMCAGSSPELPLDEIEAMHSLLYVWS